MNVLFITHYSKLYGANRSLLDLITGLQDLEVNIMVITPEKGELTDKLKGLKVSHKVRKFYTLFYSNIYEIPQTLIKNFVQFIIQQKLLNEVSQFNPDIIYSNSSVILVGEFLSKKLGKSHLWHIREYRKDDYSLNYLFGENYLLKKIRKASQVIAISKSIKDSLNAIEPPHNIEVVYNGIVKESDVQDKGRKFPKNEFNFGIVGVIRSNKGQLESIKAFISFYKENSKQYDCYLHVFGDFDSKAYENEIFNVIDRNNIQENVIFHGFKEVTDSIYKKLDCLLMCSVKEGLGRVTVEAMAHGIPVIGNYSGGTIEIIEDNSNGLFYNGTIEDLFSKMSYLFKNPLLYERLSFGGLKTARSKFGIERYTQKMFHIMESLVSND